MNSLRNSPRHLGVIEVIAELIYVFYYIFASVFALLDERAGERGRETEGGRDSRVITWSKTYPLLIS